MYNVADARVFRFVFLQGPCDAGRVEAGDRGVPARERGRGRSNLAQEPGIAGQVDHDGLGVYEGESLQPKVQMRTGGQSGGPRMVHGRCQVW